MKLLINRSIQQAHIVSILHKNSSFNYMFWPICSSLRQLTVDFQLCGKTRFSLLNNVICLDCVIDRFVFCLSVCVSGCCCIKQKMKTKVLRWRIQMNERVPVLFIYYLHDVFERGSVCVCVCVCVCICCVCIRKRASTENRYECMCAL